MPAKVDGMPQTPLSQLQAHVRYAVANRVELAKPWRVDELTRLVILYWPHRHLEAAEQAGGHNHKAIDHALALARAQVREQWEARHGVGPFWAAVLAGTLEGITHTVLRLWLSDRGWRERLEDMRGGR